MQVSVFYLKIPVNNHLAVVEKFKAEAFIKLFCALVFIADFKAQSFDFALECKTAGGVSPRYFTTTLDGDGLTHASTIISDGWICAVFSDGTTYFNGALEGRHIVNSGKNMAFRLPKLPEGYVYSSFCISGNKMAVSWEESDFYKTGRSGFLVVDLGKVLYGDL